MKILLIDREDIIAERMRNCLAPLGHKITLEPVKNNAVARLSSEHYDIIFLDPAPLTSARTIILNLRRATRHYPYIVQIGTEISAEEAIQASANDSIAKPISSEALDTKIDNAQYLASLIKRIGDTGEDFPSTGGIISKSAFNQLFLSAIERANRYGERAFIVFISLTNYQRIYETEGPSSAEYAVAKLSQELVRLRRQSDIIAQTKQYEYALLLQRPLYETEPHEAANRFAESIDQLDHLFQSEGIAPEISITLVEFPIGARLIQHRLSRSI